MADAYLQAQGQSAIGALLRKIQEERNVNPVATPPGTEISSPIRELVQPPLSQVESPESAHVYAAKPEASSTTGQPVLPAQPSTNGIPPAQPITLASRVIPAATPPAPMSQTPGPVNNPAPSQPANNQPAAQPVNKPAAAPMQGLPLATRIMPTYTPPRTQTPKRSTIGGQLIVKNKQVKNLA